MQPGADRRPPHHQQATSVAPGPYSEHIQGYAQQLQMLQAEEQAAQQHLAHIQQHAAQVTLKHATLSRNVQILRAEHAKLLHSIKQCQAQADAIAKAYQEACEKHAALKAQLISDGGEDAVHRLWGKARRPLQVQANAAELALQASNQKAAEIQHTQGRLAALATVIQQAEVAQEQLDGEAHQAVSAKAPALHALQHTQQRLAETDAALRSYLQQHQMTCSQPAAATSTASPPAAGQHNNTTQDRYKGVSWTNDLTKWHAEVRVNGIDRHLGFFEDEFEAAQAYDEAVVATLGTFKGTNFLDPDNDLTEH
ncbi:hypothetical protein WJX72_009091 [[Myrmecia] bisecta]|uniref:AP2/ERF domain-containing protein n=1 Tax=[Myrmecia] bisecta TaxID=41462 RepID=A0AAW1PHS6_9CHLO